MAESKLAYKLRVMKNASFRRFFGVVTRAHQLSGKSRIFCFFDILRCMKKFDAGYHDYVIFQFYDLTDEQKDTYLTRFRSKKLIQQVNDESYAHLFDNKNEFNQVFKDYIGREYVDMATAPKEEVIAYYEKKDKIFAKMTDLTCGHGAELLRREDFADGEAFYKYVVDKGFGTLEDVIENHPDLAAVYPYSANTMRMITLIGDDGKPNLIYCVQKFGNNNRIVDNYGVHGPVDLETGEFLFPAHPGETTDDEHYTEHPFTGHQLVGFKTPFFKEAKEMVLKAAMVVPQMRYVGWDVAITPNGPAIIEGNNYCAHDFWQLPGQTSGGIGIIPVLKKIVPSYQYK